MSNFFQELQRRNVIKAAISYVVICWVILQVAAILFPAFDISNSAIRYILYLLVGLFPVWVIFAYVFEWTPSGFKKTDDVIPETSEYKKTSRRLNHYIIAGLSIAIVLLVVDRVFNFTGQPTYGDIDKSIAVLPFTNVSNDSEQDYFSIGLTDDILTQLAKIDEFRVISRTSTMQYAENPPSIPEIGAALNVGLILEGSVQKAGNKLRITAQLINAQTDEHLWAESYDRPIDDLFSIQREVAISIAQITEASLSPEEEEGLNTKPTDNIAAYEAYQKALFFMNKPHYVKEDWFIAIDYLNEAVRLDPDFVEAYSQLIICHSRVYQLRSDFSEARKMLAKTNVEIAIGLDKSNLKVKLAQGYYNLWVTDNKDLALSYFEDVERNSPNDVGLFMAMSRLYEANGDWQRYIDINEQAVKISPLDVGALANLGFGYYFIRAWDKALEINRRATNLAPDAPWNHLTKVFVLFSDKGAGKESARAIGKIDPSHSWFLYARFHQDLFLGDYDSFLEILNDYPKGIDHKSSFYPTELIRAQVYRFMGREAESKMSFRRALEIMIARTKEENMDDRHYSALGLAYAGLNLEEEAIAAGKKAMELLPRSQNAFYGIEAVLELAIIYAMLERHDEAAELLADILSKPGFYHPKWLAQDPRFESLRNHPRYPELVEMSLKAEYQIGI